MQESKFADLICKDADKKLRLICEEKAIELYDVNLPFFVKERLEAELQFIEKSGCSFRYIPLMIVADKVFSTGGFIEHKGYDGTSFVSYLCGISQINPLPPHYHCANCHHAEIIAKCQYWQIGYDFPMRVCPNYGKEMLPNGFNIPMKPFIKPHKPSWAIMVPNNKVVIRALQEYYSAECICGDKCVYILPNGQQSTKFDADDDYVKGLWKICLLSPTMVGCTSLKYENARNKLLPSDDAIFIETSEDRNITLLTELRKQTRVCINNISWNDHNIMSMFNSDAILYDNTYRNHTGLIGTLGISYFWHPRTWRITHAVKPNKFSDLISVVALDRGTDVWEENGEILIKKGQNLHEIISHRENIMLYLLSKNVDEVKAFQIMEQVRKGRKLTDDMQRLMAEVGIPQWYIDSCDKVKYVWPKENSIARAKISWWLAYYKLNYPSEFYSSYMKYEENNSIYENVTKNYRNDIWKELRDMRDITEVDKFDDWDRMTHNLCLLYEAMERGVDLNFSTKYNGYQFISF